MMPTWNTHNITQPYNRHQLAESAQTQSKRPKPLPHPGHCPQHRPLAAPAKHKENCHVTVANAKSASQNMTCWCSWCNTGSSFLCFSSCSRCCSYCWGCGHRCPICCGHRQHWLLVLIPPVPAVPLCTFLIEPSLSATPSSLLLRPMVARQSVFLDMFPQFFLWSESALPWVHVSSMHCIVELVVATWLCNVLFHRSPIKTLILLSSLPSSRSLCNETFDWSF